VFDFFSYGADKMQAFLLVNFRISGLLLTAPIFSRKSIPVLIKVGFGILLAILLLPMVMKNPLPLAPSLIDLSFIGVKEILIGVTLGLILKLLFYAAQMAGSFVGFQSGLSVANVIDPSTQAEVNLLGAFWFLVASIVFLAIDGHHIVISGLADSYLVIPLGKAAFGASAADLLMRLSGAVFTMALKLTAPILLTVFLVDVALGVLARTIPQMNIFVIGIPVKIAVAIAMMVVSLPVFAWALGQMTNFLDTQMHTLIGVAASGS